MAKNRTQVRRRLHEVAAVVFGIGWVVMLVLQIVAPAAFEVVWRQVLLFISFYAVSATHLAGASAELPTEDDETT